MTIQTLLLKIKNWLNGLSFRTGVTVLAMCVPFYILSFAQMALPIPIGVKGVLWGILFGLAKATQYSGLTILGTRGLKKLKDFWSKRTSRCSGE